MALRKTNAELLITKGIEQKVSEYVIPDESLTLAENVDFSKVGAAKKRAGFVRNSNLVLGAGVLDEMRRLGVRQRKEVLCITETVTNLGSTAGTGSAGDTLYSYSEQTQRWIARGKMPRPNVDPLWTSGVSSQGHVGALQQYVVGGVDNYVCIAYQLGISGKVRIVVFDVGGEVNAALRESPTVVIDQAADLSGGYIAGWAQAGGNVWLVFGNSPLGGTPGADFTRAVVFRSATATLDLLEVELATNSPHSVSSDGTFIFLATRYAVEGYEVLKFGANMEYINGTLNNTTGLGLQFNEIAIDARLSYIDLVRHSHTTGNVYVSRLDKTTLFSVIQNVFVTTGSAPAAGTGHSNVTIATVSESDAIIIWANQFTSVTTTQSTYLSCGLMRMTTGALLGYFNHLSLVPYAQPFIYDGRVFFIAMHTSGLVRPNASTTDLSGTTAADESFMCFQVPLDSMNPNSLPFPCAQWDYGRVVAKLSFFNTSSFGSLWLNGRHVYQHGSGVYVLTNTASGIGQSELNWVPVPRLVRLEMGDAAHRWRSEEFYDYAAFAGGIPYLYDGTRSYEVSTALHRPTHLAHGRTSGGSLTADQVHFFRTAMLHVDGNGRECWSQPSITVEVTPSGAELQAYFTAIPVTTTMRPDMGNGSSGRMFLYLFGATGDAPNEFRVCADPIEVWPSTIGNITMFCPAIPEGNTQMYTNGFELDNFPAPPCRVIAAHSGRLFAIASDTNELWYTKPYRAERGPEFALGQSIPLPDKGTALCSLNDRLAVFTHRGILAVGGDGPDVTGTPPDAFSRPVLVSPDYGCVEYNAVGRTPLGVIFRGHQGFYLLTMGYEVAYIGAPVEDTTARWQATRSIVHDQKSACCRITGFTGDRSEELCYWYDTKRWSMNVLTEDVVDSVALGDNLLVAVADTSVALASRYRLGSREGAVVYQDFDESYEQALETGWLSFQQAGVFKRIWRVYVLARAAGADCTVRVQVWKDWEETASSDREFELIAADTEPRNLRVHLKHQKLKAIKVRVTVTSDGAGADVMKVGFELGMRTGGPKEPRENTQ
jgi:hypothetical protein